MRLPEMFNGLKEQAGIQWAIAQGEGLEGSQRLEAARLAVLFDVVAENIWRQMPKGPEEQRVTTVS